LLTPAYVSVLSTSTLLSVTVHSFPTRRSSDLQRPVSGGMSYPGRAAGSESGGSFFDGVYEFIEGMFLLSVRPVVIIRNMKRQGRSEEHTSELQSRFDIVCRLLLEKKKDGKKST